MRVLCVNDLPPGGTSGTEVHLELLLDGLRARGHDVDVFTLPARSGPGRLADAWDPRSRRALTQRAAAFRPDVLHLHNVVRELSVSVLSAAAGVPRVLTVHDGRLLGDADGRARPLRAYQRTRARLDAAVVRRRADLVLAVSAPLAGRLRAAGFPRILTAGTWAAPPEGAPQPPATSTDLLFVGRLDPDKGVDVLVQAFERVQHPTARLLLAGAGSRAAALATSAAARSGRVVLLGAVDRQGVSQLMGTARAVVAPSLPARRPEGAPLVLAEALVHGRPVVVSDDPGAAWIAGDAGIVVRAGDVAALARALQRVLDDDALVARLGEAADTAAVDWLPDAGLDRVLAAYDTVLR